jgi:hypothetical protein
VFVLGKPFQPSLMFVGKAGSLPKSRVPKGYAQTLLTNLRLDLKGLPGIAYDEYVMITAVKSFMTSSVDVIKLFCLSLMENKNKQECLLLASLSGLYF